MKTTSTFAGKIFASPLLWGGLMTVAFYAALHRGLIDHPFMLRYFAGHPIEYITAAMFFVGLASLGLKHFWVRGQRRSLEKGAVLGDRDVRKVDARHADRFLESVAVYEKKRGRTLLSNRLRVALQFVRQSESAEELDTELRYLSEEDAAKADGDYGLVRLVLWAVPMLGFLGTVVGITMALGNLDLNAINESSKMLSEGLSVAFDTTALAIALDLVLYFIQFLVYRDESNLLWEVDKSVDRELRGRFESGVGSQDGGQIVAVRRMLETVVGSLQELLTRQAGLWEQSLEAANRRYSQLTGQSAETLQKALVGALSESASQHARSRAGAEALLMDRVQETTLVFGEAMRQNVLALNSLQEGNVRQTEAIRGVVGASEQLALLEDKLHRNLAELAQIGNFEETVNSLAAAIHLLNGRKHFAGIRQNDEKGSAA